VKRLVLIGGGHSHVEVLRQFGIAPLSGVEVVLVSPNRFTSYSGMLPGLIAGHYRFDETHLDLELLARLARARFLQQRWNGLDLRSRCALIADGTQLEFDAASIDIGSVAATAGIPGAATQTLPLKPVEKFLREWTELAERARAGSIRTIAVVGGGAAGVEVLLAMQHRLAAETNGSSAVQFRLVADAEHVPSGHGARTQAIFGRVLAERGVDVWLAARIVRVEAGGLMTATGTTIEADAVVWATGAAAPPQLRETGLAVDGAGFVVVSESLQSVSHPAVFAAGDCAAMIGHPRPRSGVFAVRQGPPLVANLRLSLAGRPLRRFVPQGQTLALISTGDRYAVASRGGWAVEGAWVWRWKNWIDQRFMRRYAIG
jgi:selenide, water dikinase